MEVFSLSNEVPKFLTELENCKLCEWQCSVNRITGELGVCKIDIQRLQAANFTQHHLKATQFSWQDATLNA